MKSDMIDLTNLIKNLPADQIVTLPGGPVEILMTTDPVSFPAAVDNVHDNYEFVIPLGNFSHFYIDKRQIDCRPGQLLIVQPQAHHGVSRPLNMASFITVFVRRDYFDRLTRDLLGASNNNFLCEQCLLHSEVQAVLSALILEIRENRMGRSRLIELLSEQLVIQLIRHYHINQMEEVRLFDKPLTESQARFQPVLEYMHEHLEAKLTIEQLSELARMNRFHFIRAFKGAFGQSPYDFLTDLRITQAKRLLVHTRLSANEIGIQCGFFSASRFSAAFRQNTGMTPSTYRSKVLSEQRSLEHFGDTVQQPYYTDIPAEYQQ
jgi:AraC-like DNA-binding protein